MDLQAAEKLFQDAIKHLEVEFSRMQVGRASTAMVEGVMVEAYGSLQPLKSVASISTPDPRTIMIQPWDKGVVAAIEKGIRIRSDLGFNPMNDGNVIRINIPQPTEDRRKELAKVAKVKSEEAKISVRNARGKWHGELRDLQKNKALSEDMVKMQEKDLQKSVDKANLRIEDLFKAKEKEIMTI